MGQLFITDYGRIYNSEDVLFADKVLQAHKKGGTWDVIDLLVAHWEKKYPAEVQEIKENIQQYQEQLIDKEFGTTVGGKQFERRFRMSFPQTLMMMIRSQFKAQELPFDREFITKFLNRYPKFRIAEKD